MERNGRHSDERQKDQEAGQIEHSAQWASVLEKLGILMIRWGALCYLAYEVGSTSIYIASQDDSFVVNIESSRISGMDGSNISWIWSGLFGITGIAVGIFGVMYGIVQDQLRRKTIRVLAGRKASLEKHFDPDRSSSGLTESGDTPREDT